MRLCIKKEWGYSIVELILAMGLATIIFPAILSGIVTTRQSKPQQIQLNQAQSLLTEAQEAVRSVRNNGWNIFAVNGTYHPVVNGTSWSLSSGSEVINGITRQIVVASVYRNSTTGAIVSSGGILDPSTKLVTLTVSWTQPNASSLITSSYLTRYKGNLTWTQTTQADFTAGTLNNVQVTNTSGGEVKLANNNKAKWCSPAFSNATIDLPDGPPVAVSATASAVDINIPNDAFVATAPNDNSSIKLAYVNVTANTATPVASLRGTFTLDASKYSTPAAVPTGLLITNSFKTNDVKYYKSTGGNLYALLATNLPNQEIVAVKIKNSDGTDAYQDVTNKIYKYWTFFNTRQYEGDNRSTPNQDQNPFGYGAVSLSILGNSGYTVSGGYLYTFDLSNIDTKSSSNGLDEVGCRIELDGYDCQPNNGTDMKYNAGQTGATWGNTTPPAHLSCSDGGNIELYADHQISPVQVGGNTYVYVAVGGGTNPELNIVNVTNVPTNVSTPKINANTCGTIASGNIGWKRISSLDFDPANGTEEAANSVYAKSDGTRAYMASNGGIKSNGTIPDSDQFYIIDTTNKSSPKFLTTWASSNASHYANTPSSGFYNGDATNIELYPRRALTVLNGQRAILVGQDGVADGIEPKEYQVINIDPNDPGGNKESTPAYCGGLNDTFGFNDLTSVSELDGDNFVYMVENSNQKQLKIIQGGPDSAVYVPSGTFTSSALSLGSATAFNRFSATIAQPASASIKMQIAAADADSNGICTNATFSFVGPDGTAGTYYTPTGSMISGTIPFIASGNFKNPGKCLKYQTTLSTSDYTQTPTVFDTIVNYAP